MKLDLSKRAQQVILIVGCLAIVILWLYVRFIIAPLAKESSNLGQQVQTARDRLRTLEAATTNTTALQEQYHQLSQSVEAQQTFLPPEDALPATIEFLSNLASQTQVRILSIFPQRTPDAGGKGTPDSASPVYYKEIPIQVDAMAGYHQLGTFLSLIESGEKPIRVSSLRISANPKEPKRHTIKLLLQSYFASSQGAGMTKGPVVPAVNNK